MDILVLDAPMKFIHGKMVEQGANEWSRYLTSQFNPIGRGTLYSESFDKEQGLKVYLYSATITLECVGESKGYLKVVRAEDTDVLMYHKAIEEGKLLEEKITFVPVYKFQYINGKEHHDVERFMQSEKEKRDFANYVKLWHSFMTDGHKDEEIVQAVIDQVGQEEALRYLYEGKAANSSMQDFMPTVEKLKPFDLKEVNPEHFTSGYELLSEEQKYIVNQVLSTENLYFIDTQGDTDAKPLMREVVQQVSAQNQRTLIVAPDSKQVKELLQDIEEYCHEGHCNVNGYDAENSNLDSHNTETHNCNCVVEVTQIQSSEEGEISPYTLEYKVSHLRNSSLHKLTEEASKHNRHKKELDQMRAECDTYAYAEKTIQLINHILNLLAEVEEDKVKLQEESLALGNQGASYVDALERYASISDKELETYGRLKEQLSTCDDLYNEMLWTKTYRETIGYEENKALVLEYSKEVQVFEEKLQAYKKQIQERNAYEQQCKVLETELLEARRQYLNTAALKQIDPNDSIVEDISVQENIKALEEKLADFRQKGEETATGIISTRYLDELKEKVYKLKEQVEGYMRDYSIGLMTACHREDMTKADVIEVFKCMQRVESLFEDGSTYTTYLEGVEEYLELEVIVEKNNQLIKLQEENQEKMLEVLKKQEEIMSLLESKLQEKMFKDFLELIEEEEEGVKQILQAPLSHESVMSLEKLEAAVEQRTFKLEIYKEKVAFYDAIAKLKEDWRSSLEENEDMLTSYLAAQINVIGATHHALVEHKRTGLLRDDFEYVIIHEAQDMPNLEFLISLVRGKKAVLVGDAAKEPTSLFAKLYDRCLRTHKKALSEIQ
ncbi:MAG: hypothetical protein J6F30_06775 [Cellulosilyticum sp.]|nr:hypothetical protein [Cellulosilyticum sp.]